MSEEHPLKIGKYDIISVLGQGGMGVVYKARDPLIDRIVAIKTIKLDSEFSQDNLVKRLQMEAKAAGRLQHPNIVTVYDFGQQGDLTYLAMEYVEGLNLAHLIAKKTHLAISTKLDVAIQLCQGLAYAHEIGVVHRDIKPSNVCLTSKGVPKILDFGLARFDETRLTKTGFTSGTVAYMSPERMRGESGPFDDIFAMGAVVYEIFTYSVAFPGKTYREVVSKIMSKEYPIPPSKIAMVPPEIDPIILRAMERDRATRYATAAEFAKQLEIFRNSDALQKFIAGHDLGSTTEQPLAQAVLASTSGAHPYSDPEMEAATAQQPVLQSRESEPTAEQAPLRPTAETPPAAELPKTAPPSPDTSSGTSIERAADPSQFAKTEMNLEPVRRPTPEQEAPTEMDLAPIRRPTPEQEAPTEMDLPPISRTRAGAEYAAPTEIELEPVRLPPRAPERMPPASFYPDQPSEISRTEVAQGRRFAAPAPAPAPVPAAPEATARTAPAPAMEPPVVPVAERTELEMAPISVARKPETPLEKLIAQPFIPLTIALFVSTAAAIGAAKVLGAFGFLLTYAVAAVIWTLTVRSAGRPTLNLVLGLALGMRLIGFVADPVLSNEVYRYRWDGLVVAADQNPYVTAPADAKLAAMHTSWFEKIENPQIPSNRPPWSQLLFVAWAWLGGNLLFWRVMMLIADLATVRLLWQPKMPRMALAWALFPLATLEGIWNGHIEIVGAMLLVAAYALAVRQREGSAGSVLALAAGTTLLPVAALPALSNAVDRRLRAIVTFALVSLAPMLFVGFGAGMLDPLTRAVGQSPTLRLVQQGLNELITRKGLAGSLATFWRNLSPRLGLKSWDEWVAAHLDAPALAGLLIVVGMLILLTIVSHRSSGNESAFASCIGVVLILSFAVDPSYWLLVVPLAILSNRPVWILFALFSPTLYLSDAKGESVNWLVYGVSYVMPLLALLGGLISKKRTTFDYR